MKYKIGQKVKVKETGEVFEIVAILENTKQYHLRSSTTTSWFEESELSPIEKSFDNPEVGDVYLYGKRGHELTVIDYTVNKKVVFVESSDTDGYKSIKVSGLKELGYTIKQDIEDDKTQEAMDLLKSNGYTITKK